MKVSKIVRKISKTKYVHLPEKEVEDIPWDRLLVYLMVPNKIIREGNNYTLIIKPLTVLDSMTGWSKILKYNNKRQLSYLT